MQHSPRPKNPALVESGRRAARKRWGEPRILRLSDLTPAQRRAILTYLEVARSEPADEQAAA